MVVIVEEGVKILFHKYEILEQIGQGTESRVFLARDLHLDRLVAVKEGSGKKGRNQEEGGVQEERCVQEEERGRRENF